MVVFLPSYGFLNVVTEKWRASGVLEKMGAKKKVRIIVLPSNLASDGAAGRCSQNPRRVTRLRLSCVTMLQKLRKAWYVNYSFQPPPVLTCIRILPRA